jgi:hypothetical protein
VPLIIADSERDMPGFEHGLARLAHQLLTGLTKNKTNLQKKSPIKGVTPIT